MANAKDMEFNAPQRFLLAATGGQGKTTLFLTLPGRKFLYAFDPNCLATIEGFNVDYELFNAELTDVDMSVKTLKAGVGDISHRKVEPKTYQRWEADFDSRHDKGFFRNYDWIGFDSLTSFLQIIMDRVQYLNGRVGKQPEQADWAAQVNVATNVFRVLSSYPAGLCAMAHLDVRQNDLTKKIYNHLMVTGILRTRLPLVFNNVLVPIGNSDAEKVEYLLQTRSDKEYPFVRTNLKGLDMYEDVTIQDFSRPSDYGLGALLRKAGKLPSGHTASSKGKVVPLKRK